VALYSDDHLDRLRRIRELNRQGLTLEAVRRVLDADGRSGLREALQRVLDEAGGTRTYDAEELARVAGLQPAWIEEIAGAGLLTAAEARDGRARYAEADARALRAARELLDAGIPFQELLPLAREHARHVERLVEHAVELFEQQVRRVGDGDTSPQAGDPIAAVFRRLLPAATALVAQHFQQTLLRHARARLAGSGDAEADTPGAPPPGPQEQR
jgi:DNA-binding transcriptional MerR regulator